MPSSTTMPAVGGNGFSIGNTEDRLESLKVVLNDLLTVGVWSNCQAASLTGSHEAKKGHNFESREGLLVAYPRVPRGCAAEDGEEALSVVPARGAHFSTAELDEACSHEVRALPSGQQVSPWAAEMGVLACAASRSLARAARATCTFKTWRIPPSASKCREAADITFRRRCFMAAL
eukprot:3054764-Amphidinium_carterae.1